MRAEFQPTLTGLGLASVITLLAGGVSAIGHDHSLGKDAWAAASQVETRLSRVEASFRQDLANLTASNPLADQSAPVNAQFEPNPTTRTFGIDVSHFQGLSIDWANINRTNVHFVYVKASQGDDEVDPAFAHNVAGLAAANMPHGAYHFFDPSADPVAQADHFLTVVGSLKGQLPPVLDVEKAAPNSTPKTLQGAIESWLARVKSKTGCEGMLYVSPDFFAEHLGDRSYTGLIWLADYDAHLTLPKGINTWDFWQFSQSGRVSGISGAVDQDWFAGTVADLEKLTCR